MELLKNAATVDALRNTTSESVIKQLMHDAGWKWYHEHENDTIKKILVVTVKVHHIKFLFERLFGAE